MADIQSVAAEIRRGIKEEEEEEDRRKKLQGKNIMVPLLHRAAINRLMFSENNITTKAYDNATLAGVPTYPVQRLDPFIHWYMLMFPLG